MNELHNISIRDSKCLTKKKKGLPKIKSLAQKNEVLLENENLVLNNYKLC